MEASKGMLQKQLYIVHSNLAGDLGAVMECLPAHLDYQCELERKGIMVMAGPHRADDEKEWEGDGSFVYRAESIGHATEIARGDPMHKLGARTFRVRPWLVNEGTLTVKVAHCAVKYFMTR